MESEKRLWDKLFGLQAWLHVEVINEVSSLEVNITHAGKVYLFSGFGVKNFRKMKYVVSATTDKNLRISHKLQTTNWMRKRYFMAHCHARHVRKILYRTLLRASKPRQKVTDFFHQPENQLCKTYVIPAFFNTTGVLEKNTVYLQLKISLVARK